ncbi:isopeptide-forming domain-containing fimbrial protein [Serinibacter arcticus]|uniref:isopeptide-forming domain-containing fimbrial protein n=1 Tax=Serinibacter arcticus TaxID=1655435 RepID=UPI001F31E0A5|nr:isopeptide-forming domain-containing fimbrial protein [Serinibacter arcticus]
MIYSVTLVDELPEGSDGVFTNVVVPGDGVPPEGPCEPGDQLCTEHPTPLVPGFELTKTSDPVSGTTVQGGDTITYTVTGTNTGATVLDPVVITDDLAQVLNNAALTGTPTASAGAAPTVAGTTLTWNGTLAVGASVTLTYTVTLNEDVPAGTIINNIASGSAQPPTTPENPVPPITPPPVETEHPVPGFELTKTSDPVSGSSVTGGSTITYTVTGTNTGATVLDPVVITDDLAEVLNNAELTGAPVASLGGAPVVEGTTMTWNGSLAVGETVTITYTVTLDADVPAGTVINNIASGSATPPGLPPIEPPPVETEHPVPGFTLTKTSDPVSGTAVQGGSTITYSVTGTNTGATVLDPVVITDDLAAVLDNAELTGAPTASLGSAPVLAGTTLTWNGSLAAGQAVTLTYTVTLDADIPAGTIVNNVASGEGTPPGLPPITPPPVETEHPVPGFEFTKTSDPVSGSTVTGGDTITYTVTGTNTGATVLEPVVITDELSAVLNNADLTGAPVATVNGEAAAAPSIDGSTLTWTGSLAVGQSVALTYTVTLDADIPAGTIVNNIASGSATPPGLPPITPPRWRPSTPCRASR